MYMVFYTYRYKISKYGLSSGRLCLQYYNTKLPNALTYFTELYEASTNERISLEAERL